MTQAHGARWLIWRAGKFFRKPVERLFSLANPFSNSSSKFGYFDVAAGIIPRYRSSVVDDIGRPSLSPRPKAAGQSQRR